jgi:DNA gyrase inhibitor GyrI
MAWGDRPLQRDETTMNVTIKDMPELRLCTVRHLGPYKRISEAFQRLGDIASPAGLCDQADITMLVVFHDDPDTTQRERRSDAAILVADNAVLPPGVAELRLPAGRYACATHVGPYAMLRDAWARFTREWLPNSGHQLAAGLNYEIYRNTLLEVPPQELRTELYLPLDSPLPRGRSAQPLRHVENGYEFHEDLLPISLLSTQRTLQSSEVPGVFDHYRGLCRRGIRFVAITDLRAATEIPDARTRQRFGEEAARFAPESKRWSLGAALVLDSPVIRGALTAVEWIYRPEPPTRYFSDLPSAFDWAIQRLKAEGIPITPAIHEFRQNAR